MQTVSDIKDLANRIKNAKDITIIPANVGSGKTRFVAVELTKHGKVLFLCALRTVVNQTERDYSNENLVTHTFAEFEREYIKNKTLDELDKVAKEFDFIVIDEAHDLVTYNNFMDSVATVRELMLGNINKTILLTATPTILKIVYKNEKINSIDEVEIIPCKAKPKEFLLVYRREDIIEELKKTNEQNKAIYFVKRVDSARKLEKDFNKIGIKTVAIVGSGGKGKELMKEEHRAKALEEIESGMFPTSYNVIVATTKLSEGVNFKDERINIVATEVMDMIRLVQISGRVRHGVSKMIGLINENYTDINYYDFANTKEEIKKKADEIMRLYNSSETDFGKKVIKKGVKAMKDEEGEYLRFNDFTCSIEADVEKHAVRLFDLISKDKLDNDPKKYVKDMLKIDNIKILRDIKLEEIKGLIRVNGNKSLIYGKENIDKLKKILRVKSTQKIPETLKKMGFEVEKRRDIQVEGERYYTYYVIKKIP